MRASLTNLFSVAWVYSCTLISLSFYNEHRRTGEQWEVIDAVLNLITYTMEMSPSWEGNRFSASQAIPGTLWKLKVHYRSHNSPLPVPTLSQIYQGHTPTFHFLKIHLIIILPSTSRSSTWSLSIRFPHQNLVYASPLIHTRYMLRPSHSQFYHPTILGEKYRSFSSSLCSILHTPVTSSLLGPNILLSTLF